KIETPSNHMTEDSRWDYRVTITFKNSTVATTTNPSEEETMKKLFPDQTTYQREEQRRFEILLAHPGTFPSPTSLQSKSSTGTLPCAPVKNRPQPRKLGLRKFPTASPENPTSKRSYPAA